MAGMASTARWGLKLSLHSLLYRNRLCRNGLYSPLGIETGIFTTVALVSEEEEASTPGSPKQAATATGEREERRRPAPGPRSSGSRSCPDGCCKCDCGSCDAHARPHWGLARLPDERSTDPFSPQSETRT